VRAAEAIDLLLGAFDVDPPFIHAGGPFSGRAGGSRDDFAHFVPLDAIAELGWRIRLEGSGGLPEREFAGPVAGLAERVRKGLAELDARARTRFGSDFAAASRADQDAILEDPDLAEFVELAMTLTLDAVYGDPAYGGNRGRAGWAPLGWPGFTQPGGFTPDQVSHPDRD
jgi:hypothetical protein